MTLPPTIGFHYANLSKLRFRVRNQCSLSPVKPSHFVNMSKLYTSTAPSTLSAPLPPHAFTLLTFPTPQILLITMNRPTALNAVPNSGHHELHSLFTFYDAEPSLRCCIITGAGRAFCVGADLKGTVYFPLHIFNEQRPFTNVNSAHRMANAECFRYLPVDAR